MNGCLKLGSTQLRLNVVLWVVAAAAGVDQLQTFSVADVSGGSC